MANSSELPSKTSLIAARGFLLHLCLRVLSFVLSQLTIRLVDPTTLGRASVRLELGSSSALFLGREGFRLALLRNSHSNTKHDEERYSKDNIAWLVVPITIVLASISTILQFYHLSSSDLSTSSNVSLTDQRNAALLYFIAVCIESLSEPIQMFCIWTLDISSRALAEGTASIVKAFTLVILLRWGESYGVGPTTSFGIAQLSYAVIFTVLMYLRKWKSDIPRPTFRCKVLLHGPTMKLSSLLTLQSLFKHLLTEGDRIILTMTLSEYDQGVYAMASSYGSIICRTIFQPLEENARWLFSSETSKLNTNEYDEQNSSVSSIKNRNEDYHQVLNAYIFWVKLSIILSLPFASLAPNYAKTVLRIVGGKKWGDNESATRTLASYCVYVFFLGLNGITEAFVYSTVGNDDKTQNKGSVAKLTFTHAIIGIIFYISAPILVKISRHSSWMIPSDGLIYANCCSMMFRILFSFYVAASFFETHRINLGTKKIRKSNYHTMLELMRKCSPHPWVIISFLSTLFITTYSNSVYGSSSSFDSLREITPAVFIHIGIGVSCGLIIATTIILVEDDFVLDVSNIFLKKIKKD